jgi:ribonuclease P protein component
MIQQSTVGGEAFPKSARLLKSAQFRFAQYRRFQSDWFTFVYQFEGKGRLGVSISKKVLRNAAARNRIRRLIRETFRCELARPESPVNGLDLHIVALSSLKTDWRNLKRVDVELQFQDWFAKLASSGAGKTKVNHEAGGRDLH